jgi:hypothetical protein
MTPFPKRSRMPQDELEGVYTPAGANRSMAGRVRALRAGPVGAPNPHFGPRPGGDR